MVAMSNEVWLHEKFADKPWFDYIGKDQYGRLTVYVHFMNRETMVDIPRMLGTDHVMVHFVASKKATREQFVNTVSLSSSTLPRVTSTVIDKEIGDLPYLQNELDRLEKYCGSHALQDIFYEIKDGKNAVTNNSERFPEIRKSLERLYDEYGFDVIYDNIDG